MEKRPGLSSYKDRHGTLRWRYRRKGRTVAIPGQPGDDGFEAAYSDALQGRRRSVEVIKHPSQALPRTLKAAWRQYVKGHEWRALSASSRDQYTARAERFLAMRVTPNAAATYAEVPVADLRRRHIKDLLAEMADRPHAASDAIVVLRKMIAVALDNEWILHDPTHRLRYAPRIEGHRAWSDAERELFEAHYPLGTMPRTVYACALYTGQRRGDLVRYRWTDFETDRLRLVQQKTGKALTLPVLPVLRDALDAAPRHGGYVLGTEDGRQRSSEGLTNDWKRWTERAGLKNATLHGLRKTLGKLLAEESATTRELMEVLGHDAIEHAQLYSREAEQERLARRAFDKVSARLRPRLKVVGGDPSGALPGDPDTKSRK